MKKIIYFLFFITLSFELSSKENNSNQIKYKLCNSYIVSFKLFDGITINNDNINVEGDSSCYLFLNDESSKNRIKDIFILLSDEIPIVDKNFFKQKKTTFKATGYGNIISSPIYQKVFNGKKYYINISYAKIRKYIIIDFLTLITNDKTIRLNYVFYNIKSIKKVFLFVYTFMENFYIIPPPALPTNAPEK